MVDLQRSMSFFLPDLVRTEAVPTLPRVADNLPILLVAEIVQSQVPHVCILDNDVVSHLVPSLNPIGCL
jgi:hypothetical protein